MYREEKSDDEEEGDRRGYLKLLRMVSGLVMNGGCASICRL